MSKESENLRLIASLLKDSERIVLLSHMNPDGDAMGSSLGLYHFLSGRDKDVRLIVPNHYAGFLHWLPGNDRVLVFNDDKQAAGKFIEEADLIISLDFNDLKRIGGLGKLVEKNKTSKKLMIDHHPYPKKYNDLELSCTDASSTAELVYDLIMSIDNKAFDNVDISTCLYTGIMTDTGCFSFNSSRPATFNAVAKLLESGIDKNGIFDRVYNNYSAGRMKLLGYCLDNKMIVIPGYSTAYISLSMEEMKEYNFKTGDSEGFVNYPLSIKGIKFSVLFMEKTNHIKMSFRSKGDFPANEFAEKYFNGGGHKNAAGGEFLGTLEESIDRFISLLPLYPELLNNKEG